MKKSNNLLMFGVFIVGVVIGILGTILVMEEKVNGETEKAAALRSEEGKQVIEVTGVPAETMKKGKVSWDTALPPPPEAKNVYWDLTPKGQGLKVGDWVDIAGWQHLPVGASPITGDDGKVDWVWREKDSFWGDDGMLHILRRRDRVSFSQRISHVSVQINKPSEKEFFAILNDIISEESGAPIRVIGKIKTIELVKPFPNDKQQRWDIILEADARIGVLQ